MQIKLVQSEIELAIKQYILGLVAIRDDTKMTIDLRATRGEEGYQAFVDVERDMAQPTTVAGLAAAAFQTISMQPVPVEVNSITETVDRILEKADALIGVVPGQLQEDAPEPPAAEKPLQIEEKVKAARKPRTPKVAPAVEAQESVVPETEIKAEEPKATAEEPDIQPAPEVSPVVAAIQEEREMRQKAMNPFANLVKIDPVDELAEQEVEEAAADETAVEAETAEPKPTPALFAPAGNPTAAVPAEPAKDTVSIFSQLKRTVN